MTDSSKPPYLTDVAIEGAVDRFVGRPLDANPYSPALNGHAWASWRHGYAFAGTLLDLYGTKEARRWLSEGKAA